MQVSQNSVPGTELIVVPTIHPLYALDLAYNQTIRLAINLNTNRGSLPTSGEISAGTIDIYRKAKREDPWVLVVDDENCSSDTGIVYYDEVFDFTTGYRESDAILVIFKNISVTIGNSTYNVVGSTGLQLQTYIRKTHEIQVEPIIPNSIDLANTAEYTFALHIKDSWGITPVAGKITPGTINIFRKASGGTSWTKIVDGATCTKGDGVIYYNEVFDAASGYAAGDSIRVVFYGTHTVTIGGLIHDIVRSGGLNYYTYIRS